MSTDWRHARNILCVRLDSVGDVLMTTPALRALKETCLGRRLTLLTSAAGAQAARLVPEVDAIITFDAPWMKAARGEPAADQALVGRLAQAGFDAAVIFTVYSQSPLPAAYLLYLAGIPLVLGHCHENPYQLLSHWVPDPEPHRFVRHEVQRQLDLVATVGCAPRHEGLSLAIPPEARRRAACALASIGVRRGRRLIVAHAGASAASRRYPPESFARALDIIGIEAPCQIVLTGDAGEVELVNTIRDAMRTPALSLAGKLGLGELCAVIDSADVLLSNNSGPVHIAAAVNTPVVDLYALTNPQHTPWQVQHRVLYHDVPCRYCYKSVCPSGHHDCLRKVAPASVAGAVLELLQGSKSRTDDDLAVPAPFGLPRPTLPQVGTFTEPSCTP